MGDIKLSVQHINEQINRLHQGELEELAEFLASSNTGNKLVNYITYAQYENMKNQGGKDVQ
jgi:hypothetical protein